MNTEKTIINIVIDGKLQEDIAEKIAEQARSSWNYSVAQAINQAIMDRLKQKDFINKVANLVAEKVSFSEEEFVNELTSIMKPSMSTLIGTLVNEVLKKTEEKIKSYGFIQIGR